MAKKYYQIQKMYVILFITHHRYQNRAIDSDIKVLNQEGDRLNYHTLPCDRLNWHTLLNQ
jgi:hypothetical protein